MLMVVVVVRVELSLGLVTDGPGGGDCGNSIVGGEGGGGMVLMEIPGICGAMVI